MSRARKFKTLVSTAAMTAAGGSLGAQGAEHQPTDGREHVSIRATTDFSALHPGDTGLLAITIEVEDGWHTYWPGVSETGYGISLGIDAPESVSLLDPIWPTPTRHLQKGDILDNIYEGTQTVLVPFEVHQDFPVDGVVVFSIDADFLVCDEVCLPGKAGTTATLTVIAEGGRTSRSASYASIHEVYDKGPEPFDPQSSAVRVQWIAKAAALMFRGATRIEFFPSTECTELAHPIVDSIAQGDRLEIRFTESEDKVLAGRVRVHTPAGVTDYDIDLKAPKG